MDSRDSGGLGACRHGGATWGPGPGEGASIPGLSRRPDLWLNGAWAGGDQPAAEPPCLGCLQRTDRLPGTLPFRLGETPSRAWDICAHSHVLGHRGMAHLNAWERALMGCQALQPLAPRTQVPDGLPDHAFPAYTRTTGENYKPSYGNEYDRRCSPGPDPNWGGVNDELRKLHHCRHGLPHPLHDKRLKQSSRFCSGSQTLGIHRGHRPSSPGPFRGCPGNCLRIRQNHGRAVKSGHYVARQGNRAFSVHPWRRHCRGRNESHRVRHVQFVRKLCSVRLASFALPQADRDGLCTR